MKFFNITVLIIALALMGSTFTVDAKVKRHRRTTKKEKTIQKKEKIVETEQADETNQCALDMVEYSFQGMRMDPLAHMRVERKDGKVVMVIKGTTTDEKEYVIKDSERFLNEALKIIEQENMLEYKESYTFKTEPGERILDGYSWTFTAKMKDGQSVSSHGRNAEPDGNGLNKIGALLREHAVKLLEENQ